MIDCLQHPQMYYALGCLERWRKQTPACLKTCATWHKQEQELQRAWPGSFLWLTLGSWGHLHLPPIFQMLVLDPLPGSLPPIKFQQESRLGDSHPDSITDTWCGLGQCPQTLWASFFCKMRKIITTLQDCPENKDYVRLFPSLWRTLAEFACSAFLSSSSGKNIHLTFGELLLPHSKAILT